ncbi:MAG TPA: hypothetical protein VK996_02155 [Ramlibacter sp.]|nr:hypothetical protein [Ramlibacter sp.]
MRPPSLNKLSPLPILGALLVACAANAQLPPSSCSSDGQPRPVALFERFINADCETCWSDPQTPKAQKGEVELDWIVPGARGEDAPLAVAASRDALSRLGALNRQRPLKSSEARAKALPGKPRLRVAQGLAMGGYMGASIELKPGTGGPWSAWLVLVETIPAGVEGTPVERNLVRNVLEMAWNESPVLSKAEHRRFLESRPISIPEGANPSRLGVVGWVEDSQGRIRAIAQSRCSAKPAKE